MTFGRYAIFPVKVGGAGPTRMELLERSYLEDHGTAFNTDSLDTYLSCESYAVAKALEYVFRLNASYAMQNQPTQMSYHLDRWESILGLVPGQNDSEQDRREEVRRRIQYLALPCTLCHLRDFCQDALGDAFLDLRVARYHDGYAYPAINQDGGLDLSTLSADSWEEGLAFTATIAKVRVIVDRDALESRQELERVKRRLGLLDDWLPAWMTWVVTTDNVFILDTPANLDNDHLA